jgi:hypothetical protein
MVNMCGEYPCPIYIYIYTHQGLISMHIRVDLVSLVLAVHTGTVATHTS